MEEQSKKAKIAKRVALILGIIVAVVAVVGVAGYSTVHHYLDKIQKIEDDQIETVPPGEEFFETDEPVTEAPADSTEPVGADTEPSQSDKVTEASTTTAPATAPTTTAPVTEPVVVLPEINDKDLINILLIGQDAREGQGRQRSDSMILCSINTKTKEISLVSFLRDTYVTIPGGYSDNRINASYAFGGMPLLTKTIYTNFGVTIDGCFEVDFSQFEKIIDTIGGVEITVNAAEAEALKTFGITEGKNLMNGRKALEYSRLRSIDSDFQRTNRQRTVILAAFNKCKNLSLNELLDLVNVVLPSMTTNMTNNKIISIITSCFPMLSSAKISTHFIPDYDCFYAATIQGMQVLVPDLYKIRLRLINEYLPLN
ncbi:MAG: LCP family protein [Clostridia bacterium]|nr:LCP family protein [Clostridia bacterium]